MPSTAFLILLQLAGAIFGFSQSTWKLQDDSDAERYASTYASIVFAYRLLDKCAFYSKHPSLAARDRDYLDLSVRVLSETVAQALGRETQRHRRADGAFLAQITPCKALKSFVGENSLDFMPLTASSTANGLNAALGGPYYPNPYLSDEENEVNELKWMARSVAISEHCSATFGYDGARFSELFTLLVRHRWGESAFARALHSQAFAGTDARPCNDYAALTLRNAMKRVDALASEYGLDAPE